MPATYDKIAAYTVPSTQSTITFTSIPATYTDLLIIINNVSGGTNSTMRFNSDTGGNYSSTQMYAESLGIASTRTSSSATHIWSGVLGTNATVRIAINNYSNTTTHKTSVARGGGHFYIDATVGCWRNVAAINRIDLQQDNGGGNWQTGTTATVYGIKAA